MPIIAFITVAVVVASWIIRYVVSIHLAARNLEAAYKAEGVNWAFWSDIEFRMKLFSEPSSIISRSDSAAVGSAKVRLVGCRAKMKEVMLVAIALSLMGFVLVILAALYDISRKG
jgi:hypothetical protein